MTYAGAGTGDYGDTLELVGRGGDGHDGLEVDGQADEDEDGKVGYGPTRLGYILDEHEGHDNALSPQVHC